MPEAHDVENYEVGKGILYFDKFDSDGLPTGLRDLGNAPNFDIGLEVETLNHWSSRAGIKKKDKSVNVSANAMATFTLDEYDRNNIALALFGTVTGQTVNILMDVQIRGHIRFVGNPAAGPTFIINLWNVLLKPTSKVPLISDEWGTIDFEVEVENDEDNHPDNPYGTITEVVAS